MCDTLPNLIPLNPSSEVGFAVGESLFSMGPVVGTTDGTNVGNFVGDFVGTSLGLSEGIGDGAALGDMVDNWTHSPQDLRHCVEIEEGVSGSQ